MALDSEPFTLVQHEGFRRLLQHLAPQYPIPSDTYFSKTILPDLYQRLQVFIRKQLEDAQSISFTSDIWTSDATKESHISLTGHTISKTWERKAFTLNVKHFPGSHTGENISEMIKAAKSFWGIKDSQVHLILRDNARNMKLGIGIKKIIVNLLIDIFNQIIYS